MEERLYEACTQIPVQFSLVRELLEAGHFTPESLTSVMLRFLDDCGYDTTREFVSMNDRMPEMHELHCGYLFDLMKLFLEYGLDPNLILDGKTVLEYTFYADCKYVAADTMRLLLENGGDSSIAIDDESIFDVIDFIVTYPVCEDPRIYDLCVHAWFVLIGYGGRPSNGVDPVQMKEGYSLELLRNHEQYGFRIENTKLVSEGYIMHIFDKETNEEIATL